MEKTMGTLLSQTLKVEGNKVPLVYKIFAQGLIYSLFLFFGQPRQQGAITKFRKGLYLNLWAKIEKTKGTLFSQTLKVKENEVPLVFSIFAQGPRYGHFLIFYCPRHQGAISPWLKLEKIKALYFFKLSKFNKIECLPFFTNLAHGLRYVYFLKYSSCTIEWYSGNYETYQNSK